MDSAVSDEHLISFISKVIKSNGGESFQRIEISRKKNIPLAVVFFPIDQNIDSIIELTNE